MPALYARYDGSALNGRARLKRTLVGLTASTLLTAEKLPGPVAPSSFFRTMSLKVNSTSSAVTAWPSVHFAFSCSLNVQLKPSAADSQLTARSGAGERSLPGLVRLSNRTRLTKMDSTNAFGCHGFIVGSAAIGIVTVPPICGWPAAGAAW